MEPKRTIESTPRRKMITESLARFCCSGVRTSFSSLSVLISPSCTRRRYSGSFSKGTPMKLTAIAPTITPIRVAGIHTIRILPKVIPLPPKSSAERRAAVAAEIGLAVIACWDAITEIESGRSGRTLLSVAISEIIGSRE